MSRCVWIVTPVLALMVSVGCGGGGYDGPPRVAVSGTVNFNGQPLQEGNIFFVGRGEGQRQASGAIGNGRFSIPEDAGPNAGTYDVRIVSYGASSSEPAAEGDDETDELETGDAKQLIPAMYNEQTTLTAEIAKDMEPLAFDLSN